MGRYEDRGEKAIYTSEFSTHTCHTALGSGATRAQLVYFYVFLADGENADVINRNPVIPTQAMCGLEGARVANPSM